MLKRVKVWQGPVRIFHWVHAAALFVLVPTGLYIGYPFVSAAAVHQTYLMGWVRFTHSIAAFFFFFGFLVRGYWFFIGNEFEHWRSWAPASRRRRHGLKEMVLYYLFLRKKRPYYIGLNPLAGLIYLCLGVMIFIQAATGFALYSLPYRAGPWHAAFGWMISTFGAQPVRLVHHSMTWLFVAYLIIHIYLVVLDDIEEGTGDLLSIVSGDKYVQVDDQEP
ncbi:MAG: Ni/Fe-hydrogenase, b-type cytochrome subunit [Desulfobacteraceae bacterium]|nr:Ni/Fe-hydrogenase, b-type cytochrome subunit [Desulfobacteraceae bacterium]